MKIEEAIVFILVEAHHGMTAEQIADRINQRKLHVRKDGQPVSVRQVYAVILRNPHTFCFSDGRIRLMM